MSHREMIQLDLCEAIGLADGEYRGKLLPFSYFGGKYTHLNWILPLLPERNAYLEPYCGSAVVLLNREIYEERGFERIDGKKTRTSASSGSRGREVMESLYINYEPPEGSR